MPAEHCLIDARSGRIVVARLELATTFWRRFRGLQFRRALPAGEGLLITPCGSIHTLWMRFSIDVVMLDRHGAILAIHRNVRPWRMLVGSRRTHAVLETTEGMLPDDLRIGDRLHVAPMP
jgi:uncharacterized protein